VCGNLCAGTLRKSVILSGVREAILKQFFRGVVKVVASIAGAVFFFDKRLSGTAGLVLLGSIAVLFLCGVVWMMFLREEADGDAGYWPPDPRA